MTLHTQIGEDELGGAIAARLDAGGSWHEVPALVRDAYERAYAERWPLG